jgi:hypothetical protein
MQGVGRAEILSYFKCPTARQVRYTVNAWYISRNLDIDKSFEYGSITKTALIGTSNKLLKEASAIDYYC